jgi:hypothetical protein
MPRRWRWISQSQRISNRWGNLSFICECRNQTEVKAVDAHIFIKHGEKVSTIFCQKADGNCFLRQERSADCGIHATWDHHNVRSVLRNTKNCVGPFRTKGVECWHPVYWPSITIRVRIQLLALEHWWGISTGSCLTIIITALISLRATTPAYLPEELIGITALQQ